MNKTTVPHKWLWFILILDIFIAVVSFTAGVQTGKYAYWFVGFGFLALAPVSFRYPVAITTSINKLFQKKQTTDRISIMFAGISAVMFIIAFMLFWAY